MADKVEIDLTKLKKFLGDLDTKIDEWLYAALTDYGLKLEEMITDEIDAMHLNVSGEMKKSVAHQVQSRSLSRVYRLIVGTNVKTADGYPYPVGVHEGTIPHWPPIAPIIEWVRKKGVAGTYSIKTHKRTGGKKKVAAQDKSAAYAIQRGIAKKGTAKHPFMTNVFIREQFQMRQEIVNSLYHVMRGGIV
jgi:hypothetical protein